MILKSASYVVNARVMNSDECNKDRIRTTKDNQESKVYTYDEAINLTGHGPYSLMLLLATFLCIMGMVLDIFGLPNIGSVASCDLQLDPSKEKILYSVPFIGPVIGAYPMGYLSDIRGRRFTMLRAMWMSFIASCLAALSPNWVSIVILKLISTACSSCSMSIAYTMVGECCGVKVKTMYCYIVTSGVHISFPFEMALQYFVLTFDFSYNLGVIYFLPWRLQAFMLALPLACSAICLHFIYESPKYLVNAGKEAECIDTLTKIWKRNRQSGVYPVKKVTLNEEAINKPGDMSQWQSFKYQIVPLFQMPLLLRSLQLYFLVFVIYGACGGLLSWFPYLVDAFISGSLESHNSSHGLCNMISQQAALMEAHHGVKPCTPKTSLTVVWAALAQAAVLTAITCSVGLLRRQRKLFMISTLLIPGLAALGCATLTNVASLVTYFSIYVGVVGIGTVMSYIVDLFPTSYRGMATSLAIMVARSANIVTIIIIGSLFRNHCNVTFYMISALFICGAVVSYFLPSDKQVGLK